MWKSHLQLSQNSIFSCLGSLASWSQDAFRPYFQSLDLALEVPSVGLSLEAVNLGLGLEKAETARN